MIYSRCPRCAVRWMGMCPVCLATLASAPYSSSRLMTAGSPATVASYRMDASSCAWDRTSAPAVHKCEQLLPLLSGQSVYFPLQKHWRCGCWCIVKGWLQYSWRCTALYSNRPWHLKYGVISMTNVHVPICQVIHLSINFFGSNLSSLLLLVPNLFWLVTWSPISGDPRVWWHL